MKLQRIRNSVDTRIKTFFSKRKDISINRKIVVIESDDWGSIRMPSRETFNRLKSNFKFEKCNYCCYDSILTNSDLELLCDILSTYKDQNGELAVITANFVTSNPDFQKIEESNFREYYNESILETIAKYGDVSFEKYQQAIRAKLLRPQLHGREHLNINRWMRLLQAKNEEFLLAFNYDLFGLSTSVTNSSHKSVMAAFDIDFGIDLTFQGIILNDAVAQFKELFGFYSKSFISPNYIWNKHMEKVLSDNGVRYLQGARVQNISLSSKEEKTFHYMGEENEYDQLYLVRNVIFEPSCNVDLDWVDKCMHEVETAFENQTPAIICSHRVNFSGRIAVKNRDNSLRQFSKLLQAIVKKWPDVEFMSSDELGEVIRNKK